MSYEHFAHSSLLVAQHHSQFPIPNSQNPPTPRHLKKNGQSLLTVVRCLLTIFICFY